MPDPLSPNFMSRRDAVIRLALMMGATVVGPRLLNTAWGSAAATATASDIALLDEIADTILPPTDVPGAKAVQTGAFIAMMLRDCYSEEDQMAVQAGVEKLAIDFRRQYGHTFMEGTAAERTDYLNQIVGKTGASRGGSAPAYFRILKELTILGYFSSEVGATKALRYIEVPGAYHGSVPYKKGDRGWFM